MEALKTTTFAERRRMIVGLKLPMTRIKERLPWLMTQDEVSQCLCRVFLSKEFVSGLVMGVFQIANFIAASL